MGVSLDNTLICKPESKYQKSTSCGLTLSTDICDNCPEPGKIETPKCVDLGSKSAINSICFRVQLQATNRAFSGIECSHNI